MKNIKISLILGAVSLLSVSANALATCSFNSAAAEQSVNFGAITVQRDLPIGSEIATKTISGDAVKYGECSKGDSPTVTTSVSTGAYAPTNAYQTYASGVKGIGIRVQSEGEIVPSTGLVKTLNIFADTASIYSSEMKFTLVKIGDITPGTLTLGRLASVSLSDMFVTNSPAANYNLTSGTITQASCEITGSSAIPVNMGEAQANDFHGKNSTLTPVNVQIPLQCDSGTKVNISFAATSLQGNGIIDLASGGAEGVGIQLKLHDTPVDFDKTLFVAQATEQGAFTIPLTAAYIQSADTIKAGPANAVANFTVTYQ